MERRDSSGNLDNELRGILDAAEDFQQIVQKKEMYAQLKNNREKATFSMMMRMNPVALTAIRKEFFMREDKVSLEEFIYIIQEHLMDREPTEKGKGLEKENKVAQALNSKEQREFALNMIELFKDIDVNGDGDLEWQEYTTFTVEKANLLNKRLKLKSIAHYYDTSEILDPSAQHRHRNDISQILRIPNLGQFAVVEDQKSSVYVFNARTGKQLDNFATDSPPICIEHIPESDTLAAACANMTIVNYTLDDPNPNRKHQLISSWAVPGVQMSLSYNPVNRLLYSGSVDGNIYAWNIAGRSHVATMTGHTDIVMCLLSLSRLNNVASASLDKTICMWDSFTNQEILKLQGHRKGVLRLTYAPEYRLLVSCGFEHDACVWSPFVNSLVYRLKGHHASLVGCVAVDDTPEILTADSSGVFKLWDIRNFQCVQTFATNLTGHDTKDGTKLNCISHMVLPPRSQLQKEHDFRVYGASKMMHSFDQERVVHEATTDFSCVHWMDWCEDTCTIFTASEKNVILWDGLLGSKTVSNNDICGGQEISACCLDDRKRKIIIGDVTGRIDVYNPLNGALMKTAIHDNHSTVVALEYIIESRRFLAGFSNGVVRLYDESSLEDCNVVRSFEHFNSHPELIGLSFNPIDYTVATFGASNSFIRLWDFHVGKCEIELSVCGDYDSVVCIAYLNPYPIVAVSDTSGNITLFASRGSRWVGKRISGFMNQTPLKAEYEDIPDNVPIAKRDEVILRILPCNDGAKPSLLSRPTSPPSLLLQIGSDGIVPFPGGGGGGGGDDDDKSVGTKDTMDTMEQWQSSIELIDRRATEERVREEFAQSEEKWGRVTPSQTICWDAEGERIFTSDDMGNLRSFSIKHVIDDVVRSVEQQSAAASLIPAQPHPHDVSHTPTHQKNRLGDKCKTTPRDYRSALPPSPQTNVTYLLGVTSDASSYLGVRFNWAVQAHDDRIIYCKYIPSGVLTTGADKLVKLWSHDGNPLGALMQSILPGSLSSEWLLNIEMDKMQNKESKELDEVLERVKALVEDENLPDINNFNFCGMEPGDDSAEFSRSQLRQRIEKTSQILGIEFPVGAKKTAPSLPHYESAGGIGEEGFDGIAASRSVDELTLDSLVSKSSFLALKELKSQGSPLDYQQKNKHLSHMQQRRKANKMDVVSSMYAPNTGIKLLVPEDGSQPATSMGAALTHDSELQKEIMVNIQLSAADNRRDAERNANSDLYSSVHSHSGLLIDVAAGGESIPSDMKPNKTAKKRSLRPSGPRASQMSDACNKYETFNKLEAAMQQRLSVSGLSEKDLEKVRANREKRLQNIASKMSMLAGSSSERHLLTKREGSSGSRTIGTMASALSSSMPLRERSLSFIEPSADGAASAVVRQTVTSFEGGGAGVQSAASMDDADEVAAALPTTSRTADDSSTVNPDNAVDAS